MGKGAKPTPAPPPIPPVIANNPAGAADSAVLRQKAATKGMNYEDTIIGGAFGTSTLGSDTLLGRRSS